MQNKLKFLLIIFGFIATNVKAISYDENFLYSIFKNISGNSAKNDILYDKNFYLAQTKLNWKEIEELVPKTKIFWKNLNEVELLEINENSDLINDSKNNLFKFSNQNYKFSFLDYGKISPSANTLEKGQFRIEIGQVSPLNGGVSGGTGNQNYFSSIIYGLDDQKTIKIFYTEADDPLFEKINSRGSQPENLWTNFGIGYRWNFLNFKNLKFAIDSSLERWRVKSGGCVGFGCNTTSNNIFNSSLTPVDNTNTIYSLSFPITYKKGKDFEFSIAPRYINLPKTQDEGVFYGRNIGISMGAGISLNKNISSYFSSYFPLGESLNNFDSDLNYSKEIINTLGIRYRFDNKTALEGFVTNSFGQTSSTSILTLPSSQKYMLGGRLIYYPNNKNYSREYREHKTKFKASQEGMSVTNFNPLDYGRLFFYSPIFLDGSSGSKLKIGLSENFILDFSSDQIPKKNITSNNFEKIYLEPGTRSFRGGGTLTILPEKEGNILSSAFRLSFGRSLGETRPGYLFSELINSINLNKNLILNINPKLANTGNGEAAGLGLSINYKLTDWLTFIPEANFALKNAEDNFSIIFRKRINDFIEIDSIISNSFSPNDLGQLNKSNNTKYGINLTLKWF